MAETTVTKQLTLSFLNGEGKNTSISLSEMNESVTPEVAQAAMEAIVTENIFEKDGVIVYQTPKNARYVERHVTPIYEAPAATPVA
ncbi:hypothetical protein FC62_GL000863 [Amylolactobacillus amylotrophicus DSM 20534]|uniref:Uncharacterized protein n=3 Tax=Amylolactobacillus TaxID=2767876 RepID=A0A1L6XBF0_9LACO|nr:MULTISPECIES: DUF2922 domain-containing protein [Amylolactobacillus]APT18305.1 hypothetical protein LA20533_03030 [Amylolactobacillus amylophilus DSM 20533 = JCM 1125]KRK38091.1 hypothetical protein FC62_GL000863 [Amylolactobacillus amylotrophicus DSM 20534]KRM41976.1 hypothetical protein FD40_GL001146 [Amylolactobacillus amylophilus DSM 20533 = JCM 1125]GED80995.1 hypothetical protein LAM01_14680 [Amylolactobacillus amylophilus]